jgi:TMEM175 potassium channel family protein
MSSSRLEAFSDGVIAILITIMVLELAQPKGTSWTSLRHVMPRFLIYLLSFVFLGIYWNNHHHMLALTERINGKVLWANLHLLFWLSLVPFMTQWMGEGGSEENAARHFNEVPIAAYGIVLLLAAVAYYILKTAIVTEQGPNSTIAQALGNDLKGKISPVIYATAIPLAFVNRWISIALYVLVAAIWLIPDPRIESTIATKARTPS